jgi:3-oxoacyl-[acyl-carrier protein] reductase
MDLGLEGKRVLITGGSKGIGLAIAHSFAAEGANVVIVSRSQAALESAAGEVRRKHNAKVAAYPADLSDINSRQRLHESFPDIDILVNNAGAIPGGGIADVSIDRWQEAWSLKVFGYIHLCQLYVAKMKARKSGTIINIIGMGGRAVRPDYICGAAGNAALIGFTNALDAANLPFGRIKTAEEVAALATMLAAPQVHYLSGTVIDMDGGHQWRSA